VDLGTFLTQVVTPSPDERFDLLVSDSFWPGDHRAGDHFSEATFRDAMTAVEAVWLDALVAAGIAPSDARVDLTSLVEDYHDEWLVEETEAGGNPASALVGLFRSALEDDHPTAAAWLHQGLTSQDVVDTALMLMAQDAVEELKIDIRGQAERLAALARAHRSTPMVARTLTQHAVPTTFGLKAAQWLAGVLDAYDGLAALTFPVQIGGAAGTHAAVVELGGSPQDLVADTAGRLGLSPAAPWHTRRTAVTRLGDALVRCTDAWGRIAEDVLTLSRPEIGELAEGSGGGSSALSEKRDPVLSVLVRRAALTTPLLGASLHLAAAQHVDERAEGAWHAEWATLRDLVRRTLVSGSHTFDLVAELEVDRGRMAATLHAAREHVGGEQWSTMAELAGREPAASYLGIAAELVDSVLGRARSTLGPLPTEPAPR
jgi:3-carboxy-cis,cis-muconate cycloisomerase